MIRSPKMDITQRSTLNNKIVIFVGFCFFQHPVKSNHFLQISVYQIKKTDSYVLCTSEGSDKGNVEFARKGLGGELPSDLIARYAQRKLDGIKFEELKVLLGKEKGCHWHWFV